MSDIRTTDVEPHGGVPFLVADSLTLCYKVMKKRSIFQSPVVARLFHVLLFRWQLLRFCCRCKLTSLEFKG